MKLRKGHRVIAWDDDKSEAVKGEYLDYHERAHSVLMETTNDMYYIRAFKNCELDPEATTFLEGDEVEVQPLNDTKDWVAKTYSHYDAVNKLHVISNGDVYKYCRYPQTEEKEEPDTFVFNYWLKPPKEGDLIKVGSDKFKLVRVEE